MKRIVASLGVLSALVLLSSAVMAWPGGSGPGACGGPGSYRGAGPDGIAQRGNPGAGYQRMAVILDLSADQQEQLKELQSRQWENREQLRQQMWTSRDALHSARVADDFDADAYREQVRKHADLKAEMMIQRADAHQAMLEILTPEQQDKYRQLWGTRGAAGGYGGARGMYQDCPGPGQGRGHHRGPGRGFYRGGYCG